MSCGVTGGLTWGLEATPFEFALALDRTLGAKGLDPKALAPSSFKVTSVSKPARGRTKTDEWVITSMMEAAVRQSRHILKVCPLVYFHDVFKT